MRDRNVAIVLAAGQGKRMNTKQKKQYLLLEDKPVLYYSLHTFEESACITDVIIVAGKGEETFVWNEIVEKFHFKKVRAVVAGGKERYHSVHQGLRAVDKMLQKEEIQLSVLENGNKDTVHVKQTAHVKNAGKHIRANERSECYVWIHDGARPFIHENMLLRALQGVHETKACVVGMPVKDTVKIADNDKFIDTTPQRSLVWTIQTPQVFEYKLVNRAYSKLMKEEQQVLERGIRITDDAMVVENFTDVKVKLVEGDYKNIKITTPEDLQIAQIFNETDEEKICKKSS